MHEFKGHTRAKEQAHQAFNNQLDKARRLRNRLCAASLMLPIGGFGALRIDTNRSAEPTAAYVATSGKLPQVTPTTIFQEKPKLPDTTTSTTTTIKKRKADTSSPPTAGGDIPTNYLMHYSKAGTTCAGLDWSILAAIGKSETNHGRHPLTNFPNSHGAVGPMQFLPSTWVRFQADGDGDGKADILNPADSIQGAANLLCASGISQTETARPTPCPDIADKPSKIRALYAYNRSCGYVEQVINIADMYSKKYTPIL